MQGQDYIWCKADKDNNRTRPNWPADGLLSAGLLWTAAWDSFSADVLRLKCTHFLLLHITIQIPSDSKTCPAARKREHFSAPRTPITDHISLHPTVCSMGQNLLSVRILLHATFAFVYLPIIVLGFTAGLNAWPWTDGNVSFVQTHIDGIIVITALVGLGIFATL